MKIALRSEAGTAPFPCTRETRQCDYTSWGAAHERPACCTEHLLELLDFTHESLEAHAISHWLDYGTLLGAVRDGHLIPWDGDVDLGIFQHDAERVLALEPEFSSRGYRLWLLNPGAIRIQYSERNENHVDIWLWHERGGLLVNDEDPLWQWPGMHDRDAFPVEYVSNLGEVTLHGRALPAPQPAGDFLRDHRYGPAYLVPMRPIMTLAARPLIPSDEMTESATRLLGLAADRDAHLQSLVHAHSRLLRTGRWTPGHTRWLTLSGLPLAPSARQVETVRATVDPGERTRAVEELIETVAWLETAIEEYEHPSPVAGLRRTYRRYRRVRDALIRRYRAAKDRSG